MAVGTAQAEQVRKRPDSVQGLMCAFYSGIQICSSRMLSASAYVSKTSELRHRVKSCKCREENQLDATECFTAIKISSTCFGHSYAHHQELETILVLLPHMVCNALVVGGRLLGVE